MTKINLKPNDKHVSPLGEEFVEALDKLVSDLSHHMTVLADVYVAETIHGHIAMIRFDKYFVGGFIADPEFYGALNNPLFRYIDITNENTGSPNDYMLRIGLKTHG